MKNSNTAGLGLLKELETEAPASRKCIERIPINLSDWKPHEKSMPMGYLALLVAEIPNWITHTIDPGVIDLATFERFQPKTAEELQNRFDENLKGAKAALQKSNDEELSEPFQLKMKGQVLFSMPKRDSIAQSINHLVHHRGQLTVYMRLNNIPVPSIYGPTADEKVW